MNNQSITTILREAAFVLKHEFDPSVLRFVEINNRTYSRDQFQQFKSHLIEAGGNMQILFLEQTVAPDTLTTFVKGNKAVTLVFKELPDSFEPVLLHVEKGSLQAINVEGGSRRINEHLDDHSLLKGNNGQLVTFLLYPYKSLVSEYSYVDHPPKGPISPMTRFFRLLSTERKDILYILVYSIFIGLTSLVLPVGIQNIVQLVSGGVFFSSIYVLIAAVVLGVLFAGILQLIQLTLVEYLQRRVFAKAALEFAFRIPRIRMEAILKNYAPELVNRFFDVITLQKGLPKLLIDLVSSVVQIVFALVLLSLYHPFFLFFSLVLLLILFLIFWFTGPVGMKSSINESKHKYKIVQWLEELARALNSFKLAGSTDLPTRKADNEINNYLKYRKAHFRILRMQFSFIVVFKTVVTATLLIVGTVLVANREITLGQFVASEIIILLVLNSVEKVIMYMDVVYDLLTAVEKVAQITDLPLEKGGGLHFPKISKTGYSIDIKKLRYSYADSTVDVLRGLDLTIHSGERVCIAGPGNAGKTTLTNVISGILSGYEGIITINNYSLRDLDIRHMRDSIAKNISPEDIFDGTILENITVGSTSRTVDDAVKAIHQVKLQDEINQLPDGLNTHIVSGGKGFSSSFIHKLILARCLAKQPSLIILNDFFSGLKRQEKLELLQSVISKDNGWTLVIVSNDPLVMAASDRVIMLYEGLVSEQGHFEQLLRSGSIKNYME